MRRSIRWTLLASLLAALALFVAACGGNDDEGTTGGNNQASSSESKDQIKEGTPGGQLTFLAAADVDYLDPGQTYYTFGYMVGYPTNRTLYAYKPGDSANAVPDLAEAKPQVSSDNKTVTIKIKKGVRYAPPVNREVKAADIKYAFERAFSANVPSGYAGAWFGTIAGAPEAGSGKIQDISGITTPDDYTLQIKLSQPTAPLIVQALGMPITTPVPKEYAAKYDAKRPSTYDQYVAFTGPYMVRNNAQGKVVGRVPGKSIELVRNPNWNKATDFRPAYLDSIRIEEGNDDLIVASRRTLSGQSLMCCDSGQPPIQIMRQAVRRNRDQIGFVSAGGTRYIAFNTTIKPFGNINIRKAIIAASNREALLLTRGGSLIGEVANGWLPPDFPGFDEAGGLKQNTDLDYLANPKGDPAVAKKYMLAAKQDDPSLPIDANGRWTGSQQFLTIATNADPGKRTAEVFQNQITSMGFKLNFRIVPQDTLYTKFCGVPKAKVAICPNVGWFKDFTDPQSMLDATFNGENILQQGNVNWPQLDVKSINDKMNKASLVPVGPERNKAWADINHDLAAQAAALPYSWDKNANISSSNVEMIMNGYFGSPDLNYSFIKQSS